MKVGQGGLFESSPVVLACQRMPAVRVLCPPSPSVHPHLCWPCNASTSCTPTGLHPPGQVNALAPMRLIRSLAPKMCDKGEVRGAPADADRARAETAGIDIPAGLPAARCEGRNFVVPLLARTGR